MEQSDCPICNLGKKESLRYLDSLLDGCATDGNIQARVVASRGFGWRAFKALKGRNHLGLNVIYRRICEDSLHHLKQGHLPPPHEKPCPYEEFRNETEASYIGEFADHAHEEDFVDHYAKSFGLCLRHLRDVFAKISQKETREKLLHIESLRLEGISEELALMIGKSDYRNKVPIGKESGAWRRAGIKTGDHAILLD